MKKFAGGFRGLRVAAIGVVLCFCATRAEPQDPALKPTYGSVALKAGFEPDPYVKDVEAGGPILTKLGGVEAYVAKEPDFRLTYTAGEFALTIFAISKADTTLLIKTPDDKWVANDDGPNTGLNPLIKFAKPQSGVYNIWVGNLGKDTPPAKLYITELK